MTCWVKVNHTFAVNILAIIPARGGSKAIPRKNIVDLGGKPLIAWTIEACQQSRHLTRFLVSTEDQEIASIASRYGADVLDRPGHLAADNVHAVHVVLDALGALYRHEGYMPDAVLMLLPTSPFRTAEHIDAAIDIWRKETCEAVIGVHEVHGCTLDTVRTIGERGHLKMYVDPVYIQQRDSHTPLYRVNGAIFLCSYRDLLRNRTFYQIYTLPYLMDGMANLEIDEPEDLEEAIKLLP